MLEDVALAKSLVETWNIWDCLKGNVHVGNVLIIVAPGSMAAIALSTASSASSTK